MRGGRIALGLCSAGFAAVLTAAPALAATTSPYNASFLQERTIQRKCPPPPQVPDGSFCFTGSDHSGTGVSLPGGAPATEDFAGFVDFSHPIANACTATSDPASTTGFPDHNVVTINTPRGSLFVRTDGTDCMSTGTDAGTWVALGGTGIFSGATGSGRVTTQATGGTGTAADPIKSSSTYTGSVTLR